MVILCFIVYLFTFMLVDKTFWKIRYRSLDFPNLMLACDGIKFYSTSQHRLKIDDYKWIYDGRKIAIHTTKNLITINNVENVFFSKNHLYFTGIGEVIIKANIPYLEYLKLDIDSDFLDFRGYKQLAIYELLINLFDFEKCENFKKYLKMLKNTLKIHVFKDKIKVFQNKFRFSFVLSYRINEKIKKIYIN